jgi:flavin reductase (DIM6/NTAB) family NADH-FMN oxidoreductase RutF
VSGDPATFRAVLSAVPTSVAVVTATDSTTGEPCGMTIGSLGTLSVAPPLVLFCVARSARSHPVLCAADRYCISILADHQATVARRFVDRDPDRFGRGMFQIDGLPAVSGAAAWLLCTRQEVVPGGDHTVVMAQVQRADDGSGSPLVYHRRSYRTLAPAVELGTVELGAVELGPADVADQRRLVVGRQLT